MRGFLCPQQQKEQTIDFDLNIDWDDVIDWVTTDDEERVDAAVDYVENRMIRDGAATDWMVESGWRVTDNNPSEALRNEATRDATVFSFIQNFYNRDDDLDAIMQAYEDQGFNNGSTTHTYFINMGEGSIGLGNSNHNATLVVDESQNPPVISLNFRGMNPTLTGTPDSWRGEENSNIFVRLFDMATYYIFGRMGDTAIPEWLTQLKGVNGYLGNGHISSYQHQLDAFWEDAGPEVTQIIQDVQARHPGVNPEIILAGHSYGADAAARMVPKIIGAAPELAGNVRVLGYGAVSSFTKSERTQIMSLLGNDIERVTQYINSNDYLDRIARLDPWDNNVLGADEVNGQNSRRIIEGIGPDGHQYELPARAMAMMEVVEDAIDDNPQTAMQNARAIVDAYQADPTSFLSRLAELTTSGETGSSLLSALIPSRSAAAAPALS